MYFFKTFLEKIKLCYTLNFKIYNTILNIIIILLGNISINPQIAHIALAGFWPCDWNIISSIKEFSIRLYDSIFTNIIQGLPKIDTDIVYPIKGSPNDIDLAAAFKLEEPEDLPTLVENVTRDINRRIRIYCSITGGIIDNQALQGIIYYTLEGNATDNTYWFAYQNTSPALKEAVDANITLIMVDSINTITYKRDLTPLERAFYQAAFQALSSAPQTA